jgi:cellulose synthase/poly-beta-1,6-N-acetylglucosamine synthase-like glycosyltransferase/FtsZ-interacting cell division protein YlmF
MIESAIHIVALVILGYSLAFAVAYSVLIILTARDLRDVALAHRSGPASDLLALPHTPPVSVLVPAYNEASGIVESVSSLLGLNYADFEVIVVNDGSTDDTLEQLVEAFALEPLDLVLQEDLETKRVNGAFHSRLHPQLLVVDKENGGKSDALNVGINASHCPLVCSIDADSILESDALLKAVRPIVHRPDLTIASGGIVRIANGARFEGGSLVHTGVPRSSLARFQIIEYLRAFLIGRAGWSRLRTLLIISGAFGVFRRDVLVEVGGYRTDTVGEDLELIVRLHRHMSDHDRPYRIEFIPDPVCWTEAPERLRVLARQRTRWQRGLYETLRFHRGMLFNPRYGRLGLVGLPYFFAFELLGPFIEALGLVLLAFFAWQGVLNAEYATAVIALSLGIGVLISVTSLAFEEVAFHRFPRWRQSGRLLMYAVLENLGYRQMTAWWRLVGLWQGITGKASWGQMARSGRLGELSTDVATGPSEYWTLRHALREVTAARREAAAAASPETKPMDAAATSPTPATATITRDSARDREDGEGPRRGPPGPGPDVAADGAARTTIRLVRPRSLAQACETAEWLEAGSVVVLQLDGASPTTGRRIVDLVCGVVYARDANIRRVSAEVFVLTP